MVRIKNRLNVKKTHLEHFGKLLNQIPFRITYLIIPKLELPVITQCIDHRLHLKKP